MADKTIERKQAKVIVNLALAAVQKALEDEGLEVEIAGSTTFSPAECTFKFKATLPDRAEDMNQIRCEQLGLPRNIVGESFVQKRSTFTITGIALNRPKYPISCTNQNGRQFKFPVNMVRDLLGMPQADRGW